MDTMSAAGRENGLSVSVGGPENGPPVVLMHSLAATSQMWAPQLPVWSERFRILNVDLPGHGASPVPRAPLGFDGIADAVYRVLDERSIDSAAFVGLSLGGMVAQALALRHPRRVRALVLAHTIAETTAAARRTWDERIASVEAEGMDGQVESTLQRWFTPAFAADSPLTLAWIARMIRSTDPRSFVAAAESIRSLDHLPVLGSVEAPSLVVAGRHDPGAPVSAAEAIASALPDAGLEVIATAHLGNVEQPLAFTEIVGAFLGRKA